MGDRGKVEARNKKQHKKRLPRHDQEREGASLSTEDFQQQVGCPDDCGPASRGKDQKQKHSHSQDTADCGFGTTRDGQNPGWSQGKPKKLPRGGVQDLQENDVSDGNCSPSSCQRINQL